MKLIIFLGCFSFLSASISGYHRGVFLFLFFFGMAEYYLLQVLHLLQLFVRTGYLLLLSLLEWKNEGDGLIFTCRRFHE